MRLNLSKFFQLRFNVALFRRLPYSVCYTYMQLIGRLYYLIRRREQRLIRRNVRDLLQGHSRAYIRSKERQAFKGIFDHYFEKMYSAFKGIDEIERLVRRRFSIRNGYLLDEALSRGRGVILVTAHWGAVEFIPWVLALKGYPISVILECQTQHLARSLQEKARNLDARLISSETSPSVYKSALQSLQDNRLLMTECDEVDKWRKKESKTIELFGQRLYFDNTLDLMTHRSGAPVLGVFLKRGARGRCTLICEPINNGIRAANTARRALGLWEKYVYQAPEQWYQWKKWEAMKAVS